MKIQRYIGKDMRSALAQVRDALGADAVILSSGRIGDEVEVIAAVDFEAVQQAAAQAVDARGRREPEARPQIHSAQDFEAMAEQRLAARPTATASVPRARLDVRVDDEPEAAPARALRSERPAERRASSQISEELAPAFAAAPPPPSGSEAQAALANEMKDMRRLLEAQLATLTWNDYQRRSPVQAAMHKELAQLGMTNDLAHSLVRKLPADLNFSAARRFALATIARTVQVTVTAGWRRAASLPLPVPRARARPRCWRSWPRAGSCAMARAASP
jgi:flagellar biosynthesis protein FlhF